jgi:hypothetical protein
VTLPKCEIERDFNTSFIAVFFVTNNVDVFTATAFYFRPLYKYPFCYLSFINHLNYVDGSNSAFKISSRGCHLSSFFPPSLSQSGN